MKTFAERIHEARQAKGFTLEQLAKVIKSHKGYISGIEHGKTNPPSHKLLPALCRKLELPVEEMAALAYWEKRPKFVTAGAMLALLEGVVTAEQLAEPKTQQQPPATPESQKEAV